MPTEFKLPDLGEGVKSAEVVKVLVQPGDLVEEGQPVLEVETDKAGLDVPASLSGKVLEVKVSEGDEIKVGATVLVIEPAEGAAPKKSGGKQAKPKPAPEPEPKRSPEPVEGPKPSPEPVERPSPEPAERPADGEPVFASPSVRGFAREIGVDLREVVGTGPGGRISEEDVKAHARSRPAAGPAPVELPEFGRYGAVTREKFNKVRKVTAEHLALCWSTIPHVTVFDQADITELEQLRQRFKARAEAGGGKLTLTVILLKLLAGALKVHPKLNASIDTRRGETIYKQHYHLGVAADTDRGLVVPVVRDVDRKNLIELSVELAELAAKARAGKVAPDEMQGATFTLTNLGALGVGWFTPIVNHPQVGILGIGRAVTQPVWRDGEWVPRLLLPLSLSFDHRLVDGADGARFLRWIVDAVEQPLLLALEG